ncbi:hypothetical protein NW762_013115 [Fusarium torreyae]|uniref:Uncharacterized protein n=1 Tax=Fusarium torreyae TaxID=1237075 RepID=A0A9W8RMR0_9HYPO|nr:hypothetical protein NW762_013115 [Fusarium torreyae]
MFSAFHKIWMKSINFNIQQLSGGIKDIVEQYGDPRSDDRGMILNMLVGILTSAAGLGAAAPGISGSLTFFVGAIAQAAANSASFSHKVTPEDLNDDLENAYGKAFTAVLESTNGYAEDVLSSTLPDSMKGGGLTAEYWVYSRFSQGEWLSESMITKAMKTYVEGTHKKWLEFAKTRCLMNGHEDRHYALMWSGPNSACGMRRTEPKDPVPYKQKVTEEVCTKKLPGCIWHDKCCVCFGKSTLRFETERREYEVLPPKDLPRVRKVVDDYEAAPINNYECDNGEPLVPS